MAPPIFRTEPRDEESNSYWRDYGHGVQVLQASRVGRPFSISRPVKADAFMVYKNGRMQPGFYTNFRDADRRARFLAQQWDENPIHRKRSPMRARRASHYRKNPLSTTEYVVGGLVTAAVVGIGGYLLYQHFNATPALAAAPPGAAGIANLPQTGTIPGAYDPNNPATYGGYGTPSTATPPST